MKLPARNRVGIVLTLAVSVLLLIPGAAVSAPGGDAALTVADVEFLGEVTIPTGTVFAGTEIGGLSSITFDSGRNVYHVVSDDQGNRPAGDPVRYYSVEIDLTNGALEADGVAFVDVATLYEDKKTTFAPGGLDPEGFTLAREGFFYFSSEGNTFADPIIDPFIRRYNTQGRMTADLPIPAKYLPNGVDWGVRFNLGFESLNITPDGRNLVTAGEAALFQDGPAATFTNGSLARILVFDIDQMEPVAEYVYEVAPWAEPSAIFGVNGIVEILPIDNLGTMLVMERSFSVGGVLGGGTGNVVIINEVSTVTATDVLYLDALYESGTPVPVDPVDKRQVFAFDDLGIPIDNIEGMTFGPDLADGRKTLVIVSDNNFSAGQFTQFIVLALDIEPAS